MEAGPAKTRGGVRDIGITARRQSVKSDVLGLSLTDSRNGLGAKFSKMIPEQREWLQYLCSRVREERDPTVFDGLVRELKDLLDTTPDEAANKLSYDFSTSQKLVER